MNRRQVAYEELSEQQRYEISQQVRQYAEGELKSIDVSVSPIYNRVEIDRTVINTKLYFSQIVNVRQIEAVFAAFKDYSR